MNFYNLLRRSLSFYRKTHLWVILGTAVSTAILVGALIIGDSVQYSLQKIVSSRLGKTEFALTSGDRFFRSQLADDLSRILNTSVAPLLETQGIAITDGGEKRANNVQIKGVDARFGAVGGVLEYYDALSPQEVIVNRHLAEQLGLETGEELLLRIRKLDYMPLDSPMSSDAEFTVAKRYRIKAIAADNQFGRYALKTDQVAPLSLFLSLNSLSKDMGFEDRANVLLVSEREGSPLKIQLLDEALDEVWYPADAGFEFKEIPGENTVEINSNRIFLETQIADAALSIDENARLILTYFVNELRIGGRSTPYSFVSAAGSPVVPPEMKDDEIILNEWLARDLGGRVGDNIRLTYFVLGKKRDLIEESSEFRIKEIVPLAGIYADKDLMPDFPGFKDQENCRDWHPGIPIDLDKIRDKDEDYWDEHQGTPKAFVSLNAAKKMWVNRFGTLTAVRISGMNKISLSNKLKRELDPAGMGFVFQEVKAKGLLASTQSVDFAELFLGLSFFIIAAALLLTGLLFVFNFEKRAEENGLYLALGFQKKDVKRFVLMEGAVLIFVGSFLGCAAGVLYNQIILIALKTIWEGAVGTSALVVHINPMSLVIGTAAGVLIAFLTIFFVVQRQMRKSAAGLQKGLKKLDAFQKKRLGLSQWIAVLCFLAAVILLFTVDFNRGREAFTFFFTAGSLILWSGVAFANICLLKLGQKTNTGKIGILNIAFRNIARKRIRSLALVGILACGLFIVFTVGANRINSQKDVEKRESGTGGFALYGESSMPVLYDLNKPKGQRFYGMEQDFKSEVSFVPFRVRDGDDASCLNLNMVSNPQLLGVESRELIQRGSFTFTNATPEVDPENPWSVLDKKMPDDSIPAVADNSVIVWGMGKAVGDFLTYVDEKGETFRIKLVGGLTNSIFQGNVIISENAFLQKYPSVSGYRIFLIDAPPDNLNDISEKISWALQDQGLNVIPAAVRLAEFNKVENTYLSIFLILGSFGLLLGSVGIGIVVWRNVKEREGELALLRAVGFSQRSIQSMVLIEHLALLFSGVFLGIIAALLATLPSLSTPGSDIPFFTLLAIIVIVLINGGIWTYVSTFLATRADLSPALRNE